MRFSILFIVLFTWSTAFAQTITLTGSSTTVTDADEYFNDVTADPRNFDSSCDLGWTGFVFSSQSVSGGVWTGVRGATHEAGYAIGLNPFPGLLSVYNEDCTRSMQNLPVDASKYTNISWRTRTQSIRSRDIAWSLDGGMAALGYSNNSSTGLTANKWFVEDVDLANANQFSQPWTGTVYGLVIQSAGFLPAGQSISFDWARLYDPDTGTNYALSWTSSGVSTVSIFFDDNNSGYNGTVIRPGLGVAASTTINSGALPAGTYYFYASDGTTNSNYVGPLVVNGKPLVTITSPTRTSAFEYSRDERGDAWDMSQSTDVVNIDTANWPANVRGFKDWSFSGGVFSATTDAGPSLTYDTQLVLPVATNRPINTSFYRYACYRYYLESTNLPRDGDADGLNAAGWVGRFTWQDVNDAVGQTNDHELFERVDSGNPYSTYCIDLWDEEVMESENPTLIEWRSRATLPFMRFDPAEAIVDTGFHVDYVALYSENHDDENNQFDITWNITDPENDGLSSIRIFYDNNNSGFDGTQITNRTSQTVGTGSYTWDTSGVPDGRYYIYLIVTDSAGNVTRTYSEVEVVVSATSGLPSLPKRAPCDYDGDGKTDFTIVRPTPDPTRLPSTWWTLFSSNNTYQAINWGSSAFDIFVDMDFDGDGKSDETFVRTQTFSTESWFSLLSATNTQSYPIWGLRGDVPVAADFDGDRNTDLTVFRPSSGTWWSIRTDDGFFDPAPQWGLPGDVPVPDDYDGDGNDDLAIWRPTTGNWWVRQSSENFSNNFDDVLFKQWGLPGDVPMPGDYDGDTTADYAVWRPTDGNWWFCESNHGHNCPSQLRFQQWGLTGDYPVKGDFDGDGKLDPAIWRPTTGTWWILRSSDSQIQAQQWGLFGDWPMCTPTSIQMNLIPTS